jgi:RIO kinase 1
MKKQPKKTFKKYYTLPLNSFDSTFTNTHHNAKPADVRGVMREIDAARKENEAKQNYNDNAFQ